MKVKIKKLFENSVLPSYAKEGDAGMDLTATSLEMDSDGNYSYGVGLAFEIPKGFVGLLFPRSSNAKKSLLLSNSVGVLDSSYRGEVFLKFKPSMVAPSNKEYSKPYSVGDRIGQILIIPYPPIEFEEVEELSDSIRGTEGFGSSGN